MDVARVTTNVADASAPKFTVPIWLAEWCQPVMARLAQINGAQPIYTKAMLNAMRSNQNISHTRASKYLGYVPRSFEETVRDTLDWFIKRGGNFT